MIDTNTWYMRLVKYTATKWPQWNANTQRFEPDSGVAVCPAYARLPGPYYDVESGSYGYNGNGIGNAGLIADSDYGHMVVELSKSKTLLVGKFVPLKLEITRTKPMNNTIEIIIGATGEIQIDAVGFKGPDCEQATRFLEEALRSGKT